MTAVEVFEQTAPDEVVPPPPSRLQSKRAQVFAQ